MFGLSDISINFLSGNPFLVFGLLILLLGLSLLLYKRTNPPLPLYKRLILLTLRLIAITTLVAALFEPIVGYTHKLDRKPRVSILLDHSLSMDQIEEGKSRTQRLDSILAGEDLDRIKSLADIRYYYFAEKIESSPDNIVGDKTALGDILESLERREIAQKSDYWLLFSDGNSNTGDKPELAAAKLKTPVIGISLASNIGEFDISIVDLEFNPILFVGQKAEINVKIAWQSASGKTALVKLKESGRVVSEERYQISEEVGFSNIAFHYIPLKPGQKLLEIGIQPQNGESSEANNTQSISVKVLKSRLTILLASSRPDYEVGFLKRYLDKSDRYDVDLVLTGIRSGNLATNFPSRQADLNRYDLIILYDPEPSEIDVKKELITSYLKEKGGGIWIFMGEQFASVPPQPWMSDLLPFYPAEKNRIGFKYLEFHATPSEGELFHPAVRLADNRAEIRQRWTEVPPFSSLVPCQTISPSTTILAYFSESTNRDIQLPVLGFRRHGPGKIMALSALPLWTWGFKTLGYQEPSDDYKLFIDGITSWLTIKDDYDPIRILPEKNIFSRGEAIRFDGFAFDQGFRPIPNVSGLVKLIQKNTGDSFQADLLGKGDGKYQAEFSQLPSGEYLFEAAFEKDGVRLKLQEGKILVESFSLEEFDQRGSPATMMAIADASGGNYYKWKKFDEAVSSLNLGRIIESYSVEFTLWGKLWMLIIFIAALALEWLLRKTNHLI